MEGVKGKNALSSSSPSRWKAGEAGYAGGGPGPAVRGLEGGRDHGGKGNGALEARFPFPISEKGPAGVGAAAMAAAGALRPWAARAGRLGTGWRG